MSTANCYEALIESAARLTDVDAIGDIEESSASSASDILQRNHIALESARNALGPACAVTIRWDEEFFTEHCDQLGHLKHLARAFRAEGWLAVSRNDFHVAARRGIDILDLANATRRAGLATDLLVGLGIAGIGVQLLRKIRESLNCGARRIVLRELQRLEAERESFSEIITRDEAWERAVGFDDDKPRDVAPLTVQDPEECGLAMEVQMAFWQWLQHWRELPRRVHEKQWRDVELNSVALTRMLTLDLALREYRKGHGSFPPDLHELLPGFLNDLPLDPFTQRRFIYRRGPDDVFFLYSTGPKMQDGGGCFGPISEVIWGCADLCLDAYDYEVNCCALPPPPSQPGGFRRLVSRIQNAWRA